MQKNIIFIGNSLRAMLNFREDIINYLSSIGHNIYIIAPIDTEIPKINNVSFMNFDIETRDTSFVSLIKNIIVLYKKVAAISKGPSFYIFAYTPKVIMIILILFFFSKNRIFPFFSGLGSLYLNKKYTYIQYFIALLINQCKSCKKIICLNNYDRIVLMNKIKKEILILNGEGIDTNKYKFIDNNINDNYRFILISRPLIDKGVLVYLKSVQYYIENLHDNKSKMPEFIIYGFDSKSKLGDLPSSFLWDCKRTNIQLCGSVCDLSKEIKSKDILIIPSFREGMSRVCMEMTEYGLPIIGNNAPGIIEMINNKTGYININNSPKLYAEQINYFNNLEDEEFNILRNNIKISVRNYSSLQDVRKFYISLIK